MQAIVILVLTSNQSLSQASEWQKKEHAHVHMYNLFLANTSRESYVPNCIFSHSALEQTELNFLYGKGKRHESLLVLEV